MSRATNGSASVMTLLDVLLAGVWLAFTAATMTLQAGSPVRILAALVTLLVLPGYALTTAIFPAKRTAQEEQSSLGTHALNAFNTGGDERAAGALTGTERAALSLGLSVAAMPIFGLLVELGYARYRLSEMFALLVALLAVIFGIGVIRRIRLQPADRYTLPVDALLDALTVAFGRTSGRTFALNVGLALAIIISMGTLTVAIVAPQDGTQYTEAYLLAEQPDGEWAAKNYPTELELGESVPLLLAVSNKEDQSTHYTAVVSIQQVDADGEVIEQSWLDRFRKTVPAGETWRNEHEVRPTLTGDQLRLQYLIYKGQAPAQPSAETAYRTVSIEVSIRN